MLLNRCVVVFSQTRCKYRGFLDSVQESAWIFYHFFGIFSSVSVHLFVKEKVSFSSLFEKIMRCIENEALEGEWEIKNDLFKGESGLWAMGIYCCYPISIRNWPRKSANLLSDGVFARNFPFLFRFYYFWARILSMISVPFSHNRCSKHAL